MNMRTMNQGEINKFNEAIKEGDVAITKPNGKVVAVGYSPSPVNKLINELIQGGVKAEPVSRELTFRVMKAGARTGSLRYAIKYMEDSDDVGDIRKEEK